jgi:hypothetical protein
MVEAITLAPHGHGLAGSTIADLLFITINFYTVARLLFFCMMMLRVLFCHSRFTFFSLHCALAGDGSLLGVALFEHRPGNEVSLNPFMANTPRRWT